MIELTPPPGTAAFKRFTLHSGRTVFPNFGKGGMVRVLDEADAQELEQEGWVRDKISTHLKQVESDLLRKGMSCQLTRNSPGVGSPTIEKRRMPSDSDLLRRGLARQLERIPHGAGSADPDRKIEIGEVETQLGRVRVTHSMADNSISIHGVHTLLSEIDANLRHAIVASSAAFVAAQTQESQVGQRAAIGFVIDAALRRHEFITARVKQNLDRERS